MKTLNKKIITVVSAVVLTVCLMCTMFIGFAEKSFAVETSELVWSDYLTDIKNEKLAQWNWSTPPAGTPVWDGTQSAPTTITESGKTVYLIRTPQELYWTRANFPTTTRYSGTEIRLLNDIDMGGAAGRIWTPYSSDYRGEFNGQGYTIYNLSVSRPSNDHNGLFSFTSTQSNIHDVRMVSPKVMGRKYVGALVGTDYGVVKNIRVEKAWIQIPLDNDWGSAIVGYCDTYSMYDGLVAVDSVIYGGSHLGAVVGMAHSIQNSYATGCTVISTGVHSGGFISCTDFLVSIKNCFSDCEVYGTVDTGAFLGYTSNRAGGAAVIENCFAQGSVEGVNNIGGFASALQGYASPITVRNSYSTAIVGMRNGGVDIGSFAGKIIDNVTVQNCYAAGEVGGLENNVRIGGFVGTNSGATTFSNCYYDKQTTAMRETAVGSGSAAGITGLLTNSVKGGNGYKMTGTALTGFAPAIWKFEDQLYPQLHIFADAGSAVFPDNAMFFKTNRAAGAAYSAASVATPMLAPWEEVPVDTTYDTVRDITLDFPLSRNSNHVITWSNDGEKGAVERAKDILTQSADGYFEHVNTVGIEWIYATHTATISGVSVTAVRPLRIVPTRSLYAGIDQTKKTGEYYNNWSDVLLIDSTILGLSRHMQGLETIVPKVAQDARALVENGSAPAYAKNSPTITDQAAVNYDYFAPTNVRASFDGIQALPNEYGGKTFNIVYTWVLPDGRFLIDDKDLIVTAIMIKMNIRQVVVENNTSTIPLPKNGYMQLNNLDSADAVKGIFNAICSSGKGNPEYTIFTFGLTAPVENKFNISAIIPQYYQYAGHIVSYADGNANYTNASKTGNILVDYTGNTEAWITVYIKPTTDKPAHFEWDDALNEFGEID